MQVPEALDSRLHTLSWVTILWEPHKDNTLEIAEEEGRRETVSAQLCSSWSTYQEVKRIPSLTEVVSNPCNHSAAELTGHKSIGIKRCAVGSRRGDVMGREKMTTFLARY